ncbi:hypothetical protein LCGC14_3026130, partial [marine sediment metagenome]
LLNTKETADYAKLLVEQVPKELLDTVDFIASPALGGIELGFLVAFALNKPRVKIDTLGKVRGPEFKHQKYLIVDDVITKHISDNGGQVSFKTVDGKIEDLHLTAAVKPKTNLAPDSFPIQHTNSMKVGYVPEGVTV